MVQGAETQLRTNLLVRLTTSVRNTTSIEKGEEQTPHQAPLTQGTCTEKTSPHDIWLQKPAGLNSRYFKNQWVQAVGEPKGKRKQSLPFNKQPHGDIAEKQQFEKHLGVKELHLLIPEHMLEGQGSLIDSPRTKELEVSISLLPPYPRQSAGYLQGTGRTLFTYLANIAYTLPPHCPMDPSNQSPHATGPTGKCPSSVTPASLLTETSATPK